jgi:hypothetical protein
LQCDEAGAAGVVKHDGWGGHNEHPHGVEVTDHLLRDVRSRVFPLALFTVGIINL